MLTWCWFDIVQHCDVDYVNDVNKVISGEWCHCNIDNVDNVNKVWGTQCWNDVDSIVDNIDEQC